MTFPRVSVGWDDVDKVALTFKDSREPAVVPEVPPTRLCLFLAASVAMMLEGRDLGSDGLAADPLGLAG